MTKAKDMKGETAMKSLKAYTRLAMLVCGLLLSAADASAVDISGTISSTLTISENSQLVGNVTCTVVGAPCISFGANDIELRLNGFTMTGPADPPTNCVSTTNFLPADGISILGRSNAKVLGTGLVQKFQRHGIFVATGSTKVTVEHVTSHHNCFSGIQLTGGASDNDIKENVSVRNAIASAAFPCGGNCIASSNNNRIRRNIFGGNGFVGPPNNDFGVGLLGTSSGNVIEENSIVGNTNGILLQPGVSGNLVRRNIITGNPPVQLTATFGTFGGVDIQNESPAGANTFDENLCVSYSGAGPAPCPNIPNFAGHKNASAAQQQSYDVGPRLLVPSSAYSGSFTSSLVVVNMDSQPNNLIISAYDIGGGPLGSPLSTTLPVGGQFRSSNILQQLGAGFGSFGPIRVESTNNRLLSAVSEVSSNQGFAGFFPGVNTEMAWTQGFILDAIDSGPPGTPLTYRTNLGLNTVNPSSANVTVTLFNNSGQQVGNPFSTVVAAGGLTQLNSIVQLLRGSAAVTHGYLRIVSSQPIIAWASKIDNVTGDASFQIGIGAAWLFPQ